MPAGGDGDCIFEKQEANAKKRLETGDRFFFRFQIKMCIIEETVC